jgi:hypothetical protein
MSDPLRFFVPPESLIGDQVTISGDAHHHLHNVLRTRLGSVLTLLDGQGRCCEVELQAINRQEARARVIRRWQEKDCALPITLIQAVAMAGGFTAFAARDEIIIYNPARADGERRTFNYDRFVKTPGAPDIVLEPGDTVIVR